MTSEWIDLEARRLRLAGEDAPIWPAAAFAGLGLALALAASANIFVSGARETSAPNRETPAPVQIPAPVQTTAPVQIPARSQPEPKAEAFGAAPSATVSGLDAFRQRKLAPAPDAPAAAPADPAPTASIAAPPPAGTEADRSEAAAACLPVVSIPFSRNSASPKIAGLARAIAPLLDWLAAHQGAVMSVEGHADSRGTERHNILLSFSRAQAVKAWLARAGARNSQLAARAAGTLAPRNPVAAESNRQVILQIEGAAACRGPVKTP